MSTATLQRINSGQAGVPLTFCCVEARDGGMDFDGALGIVPQDGTYQVDMIINVSLYDTPTPVGVLGLIYLQTYNSDLSVRLRYLPEVSLNPLQNLPPLGGAGVSQRQMTFTATWSIVPLSQGDRVGILVDNRSSTYMDFTGKMMEVSYHSAITDLSLCGGGGSG